MTTWFTTDELVVEEKRLGDKDSFVVRSDKNNDESDR